MKLFCESANDVPLVWYEVTVPGGAAGDPPDLEGFVRHGFELARRGAGDRDRAELEQALSRLGASLDVSTNRDSVTLYGVCLARHLDETIDLVADVLARPRMDAGEHDKLLVESRARIDDMHDDDSRLAQRYFQRNFALAHPYARTALATESSLRAIRLDAVASAHRASVVADNLIIGFAGDVDQARAEAAAQRLCAPLPVGPAPPLPDVTAPAPRRARQTVLVDKPERAQTQILLGHGAPRFGTPDFDALTVVEMVFGGMFTSRLNQEVRVKRGWSYGAGCELEKARGELWFRVDLAPPAEVTPEALALVLQLYERLVEDGISADELAFAKSFLAGSWPFSIATARDRLRMLTDSTVCDVAPDEVMRWPERIAAVSLADTRRAIDEWLHPEQLLIVLVATADEIQARLEAVDLGSVTVSRFDEY